MLVWLAQSDDAVINLDNLAYAGNSENLASLHAPKRYVFVKGDIGNALLVGELLARHVPRVIINFAAESYVDRSIYGPEDFIQTNIVGTFHLLEAVRAYWAGFQGEAKTNFRFCMSPLTRCTAHSARMMPLSLKPYLRAQQPVLGQQGR